MDRMIFHQCGDYQIYPFLLTFSNQFFPQIILILTLMIKCFVSLFMSLRFLFIKCFTRSLIPQNQHLFPFFLHSKILIDQIILLKGPLTSYPYYFNRFYHFFYPIYFILTLHLFVLPHNYNYFQILIFLLTHHPRIVFHFFNLFMNLYH